MSESKHHIAFFGLISQHPSRNQGGTAIRIINMANYFSQKEIHVDLITLHNKHQNPILEKLNSDIQLFPLQNNKKALLFVKLYSYIIKQKPQTLIALDTRASLIASWLTLFLKYARPKIIINICNSISKGNSKHKYSLQKRLRRIAKRTDTVITISKGLADQFTEVTGLDKKNIHVIYNPVVKASLFEKGSREVSHPWINQKNVPIILGIGRFTKQKDFPTLIKAFSIVRSYVQCKLIILGQGPDYYKLRKLTENLEINSDVDFPGFVENPYAFLSRASIFVSTSRWEGLSNVLIEALAFGIPTIATNCPEGPKEVLDNGKYGYLVPVGDEVAISKAILEHFNNPPSSEFIKHGSKQFNFDACCESYLQVILSNQKYP